VLGGLTSGVLPNVLRAAGFRVVLVLDERSQPYKPVNMLRLAGFVVVTNVANCFLSPVGLSPPLHLDHFDVGRCTEVRAALRWHDYRHTAWWSGINAV